MKHIHYTIPDQSSVKQTLQLLIKQALDRGASDIHLEPRASSVIVRYRIEGQLQPVTELSPETMRTVLVHIRMLSKLSSESRLMPQEGQFSITHDSTPLVLRVSILPVMDGDKVVLQLRSRTRKAPTLVELGYWGTALDNVKAALKQPRGLIIMTGPAHAGKSTSLYSFLHRLNRPNVSIATIEDPIEYPLKDVNQTQVNIHTGLSIYVGLQALLRQDPNVVLLGEVPDSDTAKLAVEAAQNGQLVLATMRSPSAFSALLRLMHAGIEPYLIAHTLQAIMAQRLVRRLCQHCRVLTTADARVLKKIASAFGSSDAVIKYLHQLELQAMEAGVGSDLPRSTSKANGIKKVWKAKAGGCSQCHQSGYLGRVGLNEVWPSSADLQKLLVSSARSDVLQHQGLKDGLLPLHLDGFIKVLRGQTSLEEIWPLLPKA